MKRGPAWVLLLAVELLVPPRLAAAQSAPATPADTQEEVSRARDLFRAGAQAYAVGEYAAATQAFEQAYELAPRPAVLFSIAQAERRQFFLDRQPAHLEKAVSLYRRYLTEEPEGNRRGDALQALAELGPLLPATPTPPSETPPPAAPLEAATRVLISSPSPQARITLDGAAPASSPLIREVTAGEHVVAVEAQGFFAVERRFLAVKGALVSVDVPLEEKPASLVIQAPPGAQLSVDGRVQGETPFPRPLELKAGSHLITFTKSGYVTWSQELVLERGQPTVVRAALPRTTQRTVALIMFGASASALTTAGLFGYFTLNQQSSAQDFLEERGQRPLTPEELSQYQSMRSDRNKLRTATIANAAIGLGLGLGGAILYWSDAGSAPSTEKAEGQPSSAPPTPSPSGPQLSARPLAGPTLLGLGLTLDF